MPRTSTILLGAALGGAALLLASRAGAAQRLPRSTTLYTLRSQPFPDAGPGVLVHVPEGFDPSRPTDVLVYFRGWNSCVSVLAGDRPAACRPSGSTRRHSDLAGQFDRAGVNALLVMPELRVEEATGDPGQLRTSGAFARLLTELFEVLSPLGLQPLRRVALAAHSGGYVATAAVLERGGVAIEGPVGLFDALYGESSVFERAALSGVRLLDLYTSSGGTADNSRALGARLASRMGGVVLDDRASAPTPEQWAAQVLIKKVPEDHSSVPLRHFGSFVGQCGFDAI